MSKNGSTAAAGGAKSRRVPARPHRSHGFPTRSHRSYGFLARSLLLFALSWLLNCHTVLGGFVFDDNEAIVTNPDIRLDTPLSSVFTNDFWGSPLSDPESHKSFRPLTVLSFRFNYWLHRLSPGGYHVVNVLVYSVVCVLVLHVLIVAGVTGSVSWLTALLFTVHPIHTEAVANVVGRAELLSALFYLLSFLSYLVSCKTTNGSISLWSILSVLLAVVSMLCKEQGITVLGLCLFYELLLRGRTIWQLFRGTLKSTNLHYLHNITLITLSLGFILLVRLLIGQGRPVFVYSDNPTSFSDSILTRTLTYTHLASLNVWLLMCPSLLCFDWSMGSVLLVETLNDHRNIGTLLLFAFLLLLIIKNVEEFFGSSTVSQTTTGGPSHNRLSLCWLISTLWPIEKNNSLTCLLGAALLIIPYIPASNLFFPVGFVLAERVLYLPSIGYCLLVSIGFKIIDKKLKSYSSDEAMLLLPDLSKPLMALFFAILFMFSAKTVARNWEWRDTESLAISGLKVNPGNAKVHFTMGNVLAQQGNRSCESYYRHALEIKPDYILAWANLGLVLLNTGRAKEAEECYRRALSIKPDHVTANINMGHLCRIQERWEEALKHYNTAKKRRPRSPIMRYYAGWMLSEIGEREEAEKELTIALQLYRGGGEGRGEYGDAHLMLGRLLSASKESKPTSVRRLKAIDHYRKGFSLSPKSVTKEDYLRMGRLLAGTGEVDEAKLYLRLAVKEAPDFLEAQKELDSLERRQFSK